MFDEKQSMDVRLDAPAQKAIRGVIQEMPEESLSLAWRSGLNERLLVESQKRQRRARLFWTLRPIAGLAFAGAIAAFFVLRVAPLGGAEGTTSGESIEAQLLTAHVQSTQFADVAGTGVRPSEAAYAARTPSEDTFDWDEVDIESL
jgi:hypothetical protein